MSISISPVDATLGAEITNVDLANLSETDVQEILDAFHQFGVLIFPQQHIDDEAQINFSLHFGKMEFKTPNNKAGRVSNQKADGSISQSNEHQTKILRGNEGWHTDSSYMPLAAKASCLSALVVPSEGGQTAWADMRAAYDALSQEMKDKIADLTAYHSLYQSQAKIGHNVKTGDGYGFHAKGAPIRPLVKIHPVTNRPSLFIGRHAYRIPGMDEQEGKQLLAELMDFACQPPRIYEHNWQVGDLCIWDNRCVLHQARPYDYNEVRVLRHTRIAGDPRTELVETAPDDLADGFEVAAG
ncbi:MAG: TauD/TfdA family dioxygenase [Gammaproteobacteria bacterium]|nr:TauD/TfdA family dioxygenase [Gammaproteobacteria bacterium]